MAYRILVVLTLAMVGCTAGSARDRDGGADGGGLEGCTPEADADGDGVADAVERDTDPDGDGRPSHMDDDADGDGISDFEEQRGNPPCLPRDDDGDHIYNIHDLDSDNDGLTDREERERYHTDPYNKDSDGDGVTDLGEARGTGTDPNDPSSTIDPGDFFVVLPYGAGPEDRTLRFDTDLQLADVYFLIDTTGSMQASIDNVRSTLTSLSTRVQAEIPSVAMGVGQFKDFPNGTDTPFENAYGGASDFPYANEQNITSELADVQSALGRLSAAGGADGPESQIEALYQTATGMGGRWTFGSGADPFELAPGRCPAVLDERGRRRGYPCFRPSSLPIVVLVADASPHNGPDGADGYESINPAPHSFDDAVVALDSLGARFIGVSVRNSAHAWMDTIATETGSVDLEGNPLVYEADDADVSARITDGIATIAGRTPQDVDTVTENHLENPDNFDATQFIVSITPVEGFNGAVSGPMPGVTYTSRDERQFRQVVPGTLVDFAVRFDNQVREPSESAEVFRARIIVRGNGVARLDARDAYIIVPPDGAVILI